MSKRIEQQRKIIMDWLHELEHPCFSVHDMDFLDYWTKETGLSERTLKKRINELVDSGRLDRTRMPQEATRPPGIPKWFFVYR